MNAITQLETLGYSFTLNGNNIHYNHQGELVDPATVRTLLAELKEHKAEAVEFLQERIAPPDPLYLAVQKASYPKVIEWPEGKSVYHTPDELFANLWLRSMLKEVMSLGGVVFSET